MLIPVCKAKIHQAKVTQADPHYVGSISIDEALLEAAGIVPFQYVNITNSANGVFWRTYVMAAQRGHGDICLNGPPSRHFQPGDIIIILAEVLVEPKEMAELEPIVVFVDERNQITEVRRHTLVPHPLA
ncbi:MAG: aspartate 1-decarboxylase [Minisyncoccota bacterium]